MRLRYLFHLLALYGIYHVLYFTYCLISTGLTEIGLVGNKKLHKDILLWNPMFGDKNFLLGDGFIAGHCPRYKNCRFTHDRLLQKHYKYEAVVFNGLEDNLIYKLPSKRSPNQIYVFAALESPAAHHVRRAFKKFYNVTMTYQLDSDVVWTYADVYDLKENRILGVKSISNYTAYYPERDKNEVLQAQINHIAYGKSKVAVWYSSQNCNSYSAREKYVAELEEYMYLDRFGSCSGKIGCSKEEDCFEKVDEPEYFFYFAFENTLCNDYVTEKLFNALQYYIVPVVYGGANYSLIAPPNSYINALDFDSPKQLASYLKYLTQNITAYVQYFEWKKRYRVLDPRSRVICDLCELVNTREERRSHIITKWFTKSRCPVQVHLYKQQADRGNLYATKHTVSNAKRLLGSWFN